MEDNIPAEVKQERSDEIMAMQQEISLEINQQKVGKTVKVLFDRNEDGYFIGRTEHDSPEVDNEVLVKAEGDAYARIGDFANVQITSASEFDLYGNLV
jgi:ribosomal protein S12 methylthiotransferase